MCGAFQGLLINSLTANMDDILCVSLEYTVTEDVLLEILIRVASCVNTVNAWVKLRMRS